MRQPATQALHSEAPAGNLVPQFLQKVAGRSFGPQSWKSERFPGSDSAHHGQNCPPLAIGALGAAAGPDPGLAPEDATTRAGAAALGVAALGVGRTGGGFGFTRVASGALGPSTLGARCVPDTGQREKAKMM